MLRVALALRYVMLIGSLAALAGAFLMFFEAAAKLAGGVRAFLADGGHGKSVLTAVMGATDACLFGIVLMVFAYSIAFGFVFDIEPGRRERLPVWMRLHGVHELKHTLVQVVLVYLVVDFATDVAQAEAPLGWEMLVKPIAVLMVAAALWLMAGPRAG